MNLFERWKYRGMTLQTKEVLATLATLTKVTPQMEIFLNHYVGQLDIRQGRIVRDAMKQAKQRELHARIMIEMVNPTEPYKLPTLDWSAAISDTIINSAQQDITKIGPMHAMQQQQYQQHLQHLQSVASKQAEEAKASETNVWKGIL